jgi:hypothetical protein
MGGSQKSHEGSFYHRRDPFASPLWQVVDRFYDEFERVYPERYEKTYGFWRPLIGDAVGKFLLCGDFGHREAVCLKSQAYVRLPAPLRTAIAVRGGAVRRCFGSKLDFSAVYTTFAVVLKIKNPIGFRRTCWPASTQKTAGDLINDDAPPARVDVRCLYVSDMIPSLALAIGRHVN